MLVRTAKKQRVIANLAVEPRMDVGGQDRAREIADMLDAVDVRERTGDQNLGHWFLRSSCMRCGHEKPSAEGGPEERDSLAQRITSPAIPPGRAGAFVT